MAITITRQPSSFTPVYNDMTTIVSSTNTAQAKFSYIFQVYANGTLVSTQRVAPEYQFGYGIIDAGKILKSYVTTDFFANTSTDVKESTNSFLSYEIKIGEEYDVSGTLTQFLDLANYTDKAFNGSLLFKNFLDFDITDYTLGTTLKQFLTDNPSEQNVTLNDFGYISYYNGSTPQNVVYKTYSSAGVFLNSGSIDVSAFREDIVQVPSAPASINAVTLTSGTQPLIDSAVGYYTIEMQDGVGVTISELKKFTLTTCQKARLHFLNDLGTFDAFNFVASKETFDFEKEFYKRSPNRITSSGGYNLSRLDREGVQYFTKSSSKIKLNSDWITDYESTWLRQLFDSPEIYLEVDGVISSLKGVTETNYEVKESEYDDLFNIELEVELGIENYRQSG